LTTLECHCASGADKGIITQYTGIDCSQIAPPPVPVCQHDLTGVAYPNCSSCIGAAIVQGLSCEWCPNSVTNYSAYLIDGTCLPSQVCTTVRVSDCVPPPTFTIPACPDDCLGNGDCLNVSIPLTCFDKTKNGAETDVDCGGPDCYQCTPTKHCTQDADCLTGLCEDPSAAPPSTTGAASGTGTGTTSTCTAPTCACGGSGFYTTPTSLTAQRCVCHTGFSGNNCGIAPAIVTTSSTIIGASLGAAAVVGIIIGALLCAAASGGGALAVYNKSQTDVDAPITSNPLYVDKNSGGDNPLFQN